MNAFSSQSSLGANQSRRRFNTDCKLSASYIDDTARNALNHPKVGKIYSF